MRLEKSQPYEVYSLISRTYRSSRTADRYVIGVEEMRQSLRIVEQCLERPPSGQLGLTLQLLSRPAAYETRWVLIPFLAFDQFCVPAGEAYVGVEAPGEFGCTVSDGTGTYRCKVRAPGFAHLAGLNMSRGHMLADVVTIIGTQDIVFGEVDR